MTVTMGGCMTRGGWMILVTDTSVACKWVVREDDFEKARQLLSEGHELHVPRVLATETANALWSKVRSGILTPGDVSELLEQVLALNLHWATDEDLAVDALRIAISLNHPVYDCVYLALAYQVDGTLVTADTRFFNIVAATEHVGRVALLANFTPQES